MSDYVFTPDPDDDEDDAWCLLCGWHERQHHPAGAEDYVMCPDALAVA